MIEELRREPGTYVLDKSFNCQFREALFKEACGHSVADFEGVTAGVRGPAM